MSKIAELNPSDLLEKIRVIDRGLGVEVIKFIDRETKSQKIEPLSPGFVAILKLATWALSMCTIQEQNKLFDAMQSLTIEYHASNHLLGRE